MCDFSIKTLCVEHTVTVVHGPKEPKPPPLLSEAPTLRITPASDSEEKERSKQLVTTPDYAEVSVKYL